MDFTPGEDSLLIEYDPDSGEPQLEVTQDTADTGLFRVTLNGTEVALVHSPTGLGPADIALVPPGTV